MEKANKKLSTQRILEVAATHIQKCTKLQLENIVFPKWNDLGLLGMIFRQDVCTKEQPEGHVYDEATYQVVMRIISGHVLMTGGRPDSYTWKQSKVQSSKNVRFIGCNSAEALINLSTTLMTISDEEEKRLFADMFCNLKKDLLLITSPKEERLCIEITPELYHAGITYCIDEWMEPDENGEADITQLNIGDYLIVSANKDSVYCIRHAEFVETHSLEID